MRRTFWLLPDPHFGHQKLDILRRKPFFENLIFKSIMEKPKSDILIVLGDFIFKKHGYLETWLEIVADRSVWLIRGNHDKETIGWYYSNGFAVVADELKVNMYGIEILLTHKPVKRKDYTVNVCAHLHGATGHRSGFKLDKKCAHVHIETPGHKLLHLQSVVQRHLAKMRKN